MSISKMINGVTLFVGRESESGADRVTNPDDAIDIAIRCLRWERLTALHEVRPDYRRPIAQHKIQKSVGSE
jgi:hypothetical protein